MVLAGRLACLSLLEFCQLHLNNLVCFIVRRNEFIFLSQLEVEIIIGDNRETIPTDPVPHIFITPLSHLTNSP